MLRLERTKACGENASMNEHQGLLDEARRFCNPATGEVIELIPEELMSRLRAAKLAIGIAGEPSQTAASAKWIVFLDDEIREQAVTRWRAAQRRRRPRTKRPPIDSSEQAPISDVGSLAKTKVAHGLAGFLRNRKPD